MKYLLLVLCAILSAPAFAQDLLQPSHTSSLVNFDNCVQQADTIELAEQLLYSTYPKNNQSNTPYAVFAVCGCQCQGGSSYYECKAEETRQLERVQAKQLVLVDRLKKYGICQ